MQASNICSLVIRKRLTSTFPDEEIALRISQCLALNNATGERNICKIKYLKRKKMILRLIMVKKKQKISSHGNCKIVLVSWINFFVRNDTKQVYAF